MRGVLFLRHRPQCWLFSPWERVPSPEAALAQGSFPNAGVMMDGASAQAQILGVMTMVVFGLASGAPTFAA